MKTKKLIVGLFTTLLAFLAFISSCIAWVKPRNEVKLNSGEGYTASSYFGGGNGSGESPYIINNPIHLYNLAWLQYLGYFNTPSSSNAYTQFYFELTLDLDMSGYVLPPIGTTDNPFIGNFEGNGKEISNLTVSNALGTGNIEKKPLVIDSITGVNIVGLFGVIGELGNALTATYDSSIISISNFYLSGIEVASQLNSTLIGIVAGYVNGKVEGIGVSDSIINVDIASTPYNSITSNLSDYSLFGHCTNEFKSYIKVDKVSMKVPVITTSKFVFENNGDGESNGWGGSIDMLSMYNRLFSIYDRTSNLAYGVLRDRITIAVNGNSTTSSTNSTGFFKQYYNANAPLMGRFTFSPYNAAATTKTFLYMYGKKALEKTVDTYQQSSRIVDGFRIRSSSSTTTFLSTNAAGTSIANATSEGAAAIWAYDSSNRIYTFINGSRIYLTSTGTTNVSLTATAPAVYWTYASNLLRTTVSGSTRYLRYNNGWVATTTSSQATTVTMIDTTFNEIEEELISSVIQPNGVTTMGTYFPLNVDSSTYLPKQNNTGYVIGGSNYSHDDYPYRSGDLRVSQYSLTNLSAALGASTSTFTSSRLEVVTRTANSGGFVRISDDFNAANPTANINATLRTTFATKTNYATLGLEKYKTSRNSLGTVLSSSSNVYGLHFMDSSINMNNLIVADEVLMNKEIHTNFELPEDSIDFILQEKGRINFFSGTYFAGNNSFFALTEIERDAYQKITAIKEISYIYGSSDSSKPYLYQYSDGTYSVGNSIPSGYSLVFDVRWITNPTMVENAMYYFEIPVNEGEYALGSAEGKTGAYLLYLDISANAQEINRTQVIDQVTIETNTYEYPTGGAFIANSGDTVDAKDSVAVALQSNFTGTILFSRTDNIISITSGNNKISPGYIGEHNTLTHSSDILEAIPIATTTKEINRMTWIDYNTSTGVIETTTIEETKINNVLVGRTFSCIDQGGNAVSGAVDQGTAINLSGLNNVMISFDYYYSNNGEILFYFIFSYQYDDNPEYVAVGEVYQKITSYSLTITSNENTTVTITYLDTIYEISINGTLITINGTTIPIEGS